MLLLPEIQTGEVWERSKNQRSFGYREALDRKALSLLRQPLTFVALSNVFLLLPKPPAALLTVTRRP
jgi:hypothetical protein